MILLRPIELTPRLLALARQVHRGARFADIGTDHARLPVWLLEQGVVSSAIAADLRNGPLDRARRTAAHHAVTERISFRLGDGLRPLRAGEADVIAIAGMGGETIAEILADAPWTKGEGITLLLQPMTSADALRRWLSEHKYRIVAEQLVREESTIYVVLTVDGEAMPPLRSAEIWAGRQWLGMEEPLRGEYLRIMTDRAEKALDGVRRSTKAEDAPRKEAMVALCAELTKMKEEWDAWQR